MRFKIRTENGHKVTVLFAALWSVGAFFPLVLSLIRRIPLIGEFADYYLIIFFVTLALLAIIEISRVIKLSDLNFLFIILITSMIQFILNSNYTVAFSDIWFEFLVKTVPYYFLGLAFNYKSIINVESKEYRLLILVTYINLIADIIFFITYSKGQIDSSIYVENGVKIRYSNYMYFAYLTIQHTIFLLYDYMNRKKVVSLLSFILGTIVVLMQGTRGAVLCLLVYFLIVGFQEFRTFKTINKIFFISTITTLSLILFSESKLILLIEYMRVKTYNIGFSTRIFDSILQSKYIGDSGRSVLISNLYSSIANGPLFGYGLTADIGITGQYSHNIFIEILIEFGIIIGPLISLIIIYILVKAFVYSEIQDPTVVRLWMIFFCIGFIKLFMSGTYLTEEWFFFLIGFSVQIIRGHQVHNKKRRII